MGLQIGGGVPIGPVLEQVRGHGCDVVRLQTYLNDAPAYSPVPPGVAEELVLEVRNAGLRPYVNVRTADQILELPPGIDVEFGNEPDLAKFGWTESSYRRGALDAVDLAHGRNPLWLGVVSNLNRRGFRFLRSLPWAEIPTEVGCAVHRYPDTAGPERSHMRDWFGIGRRWSRDDEIRELRSIVGPRPLALSEIGYHTGPGGWGEADSARHMAWERAFFARHGFVCAIAYQLVSGPPESSDYEDHFGFQRFDGSWRPVADAWFGG